MATKQEIITAIDGKIIAKGNISAVDTNKILKDILEFSDKPVTSINGFDFGNIDNPLRTEQLASVKVNFTGIEKLSCSLYICIEAGLQEPPKEGQKNNVEWLFIPLKEEEYEILLSFLPNINNKKEKQMYLTFMVPFLRAEENVSSTTGIGNNDLETGSHSKSGSDFPMMIIGLGLLIDLQNQKGLHIILPESGHISTSMALSYKPNNFEFGLFSKEMQKSLNDMWVSIIKKNDLNSKEK
jgi:hypothetical protein